MFFKKKQTKESALANIALEQINASEMENVKGGSFWTYQGSGMCYACGNQGGGGN